MSIFDRFMFWKSVIDVKVTLFKCLDATIPLTCTLANEYPSSNAISKKNNSVRGNCIACNALLSIIFNAKMEKMTIISYPL